jgi:hypothetical protein
MVAAAGEAAARIPRACLTMRAVWLKPRLFSTGKILTGGIFPQPAPFFSRRKRKSRCTDGKGQAMKNEAVHD